MPSNDIEDCLHNPFGMNCRGPTQPLSIGLRDLPQTLDQLFGARCSNPPCNRDQAYGWQLEWHLHRQHPNQLLKFEVPDEVINVRKYVGMMMAHHR